MVVPRSELRATVARLLRLLPPAAAEDGWQADDERRWGPIGVLSGLAERLGSAVSETVGLDLDKQPDVGNGHEPNAAPARERER